MEIDKKVIYSTGKIIDSSLSKGQLLFNNINDIIMDVFKLECMEDNTKPYVTYNFKDDNTYDRSTHLAIKEIVKVTIKDKEDNTNNEVLREKLDNDKSIIIKLSEHNSFIISGLTKEIHNFFMSLPCFHNTEVDDIVIYLGDNKDYEELDYKMYLKAALHTLAFTSVTEEPSFKALSYFIDKEGFDNWNIKKEVKGCMLHYTFSPDEPEDDEYTISIIFKDIPYSFYKGVVLENITKEVKNKLIEVFSLKSNTGEEVKDNGINGRTLSQEFTLDGNILNFK